MLESIVKNDHVALKILDDPIRTSDAVSVADHGSFSLE